MTTVVLLLRGTTTPTSMSSLPLIGLLFLFSLPCAYLPCFFLPSSFYFGSFSLHSFFSLEKNTIVSLSRSLFFSIKKILLAPSFGLLLL